MMNTRRLVAAFFVVFCSPSLLIQDVLCDDVPLPYKIFDETATVPDNLKSFITYNSSKNVIIDMKPGVHDIKGALISMETGDLVMEIEPPPKVDSKVTQTLIFQVQDGELKYDIEWSDSRGSPVATLQGFEGSGVDFYEVSKFILTITNNGTFYAVSLGGSTKTYPNNGQPVLVPALKGLRPTIDGKELLNFTISWNNPLSTSFKLAFPSGVVLAELYVPQITTSSTVPASGNRVSESSSDVAESGLSTDAIIGISVGCGVAFIVLIVGGSILFYKYYWKKRQAKKAVPQTAGPSKVTTGPGVKVLSIPSKDQPGPVKPAAKEKITVKNQSSMGGPDTQKTSATYASVNQNTKLRDAPPPDEQTADDGVISQTCRSVVKGEESTQMATDCTQNDGT